MASSAVLVSRNEPYLMKRSSFMKHNLKRNPNPNKKPKPNPTHNLNPNPTHNLNPNPTRNSFYDDSSTSPTSAPALSVNSSSLNHHHQPYQDYISLPISSYSKAQMKDLRKRLVAELHQIRTLSQHLDSQSTFHPPQLVGSQKIFQPPQHVVSQQNKKAKREITASYNAVDVKGQLAKCGKMLVKLMKRKNSWVFNTPVDVETMRLHDYYTIIKRPMDLGTVKKKLNEGLYKNVVEFSEDVKLTFKNALVYNPEDHEVYGMANEMLGFFVDMWESEFKGLELGGGNGGSDGGGGGREVGVQQGRWGSEGVGGLVEEEEEMEMEVEMNNPGSSWSRIPSTPVQDSARRPTPVVQNANFSKKPSVARSSKTSSVLTPDIARRAVPVPVPAPAPAPEASIRPMQNPSPNIGSKKPSPNVVSSSNVVGRLAGAVKKGKPKARDPNKRDMTFEEKRKLSLNLQDIPQEKMENVVHIIRKRNGNLAQDGDEIELDIEVLDNETLWELDRFIINHKKSLSKVIKNASQPDKSPVSEMVETATKKDKNIEIGNGGEEDVEIDDEIPATLLLSVEIAKDDTGHAAKSSSTSSSSSSDGSSSSDSDSASSSGSESDAGDGDVGSKSPLQN